MRLSASLVGCMRCSTKAGYRCLHFSSTRSMFLFSEKCMHFFLFFLLFLVMGIYCCRPGSSLSEQSWLHSIVACGKRQKELLTALVYPPLYFCHKDLLAERVCRKLCASVECGDQSVRILRYFFFGTVQASESVTGRVMWRSVGTHSF